jgi:hypothetical protein
MCVDADTNTASTITTIAFPITTSITPPTAFTVTTTSTCTFTTATATATPNSAMLL